MLLTVIFLFGVAYVLFCCLFLSFYGDKISGTDVNVLYTFLWSILGLTLLKNTNKKHTFIHMQN